MSEKATITLGGVTIAGNTGITWRLQTGTQPYTAIFTVHKRAWQSLVSKVGKPITLSIKDSRGVTTKIEKLYILHQVPSDGPNRVQFVVADLRWKWSYKLIARDYNMAKKTGDRTALNPVPVETNITVDQYEYRQYSIDGDKRWTAKKAVEDCLKLLCGTDDEFRIESFPIEGDSEAGQFTLQNIMLRDQGDAALARLLSFIPGAEVTVDPDGKVRVFDSADLNKTEAFFATLPPTTWDGDYVRMIRRTAIRPSKVFVYYQREVELLLDFRDDYGPTVANPGRDTPFVENVLPTVDPQTVIDEVFDPELNQSVPITVPAGTWVPVRQWLKAMDDDRPEGSLEWTFETIRRHWIKGDLDGVLGGAGARAVADLDETANVQLRVQALKQHFRQTFRINRRYTQRIRDIRSVRSGLLDPVTGARQPAGVWGQACVIPSVKGQRIAARREENLSGVWRNVDYTPQPGQSVLDKPPGPVAVDIVDAELGIYHLEWLLSPYGTVEAYVPCHTVSAGDQPKVPIGDLGQQDTEPMGPGMVIESGTNGIFLRNTMKNNVMLTVVPAAPNNLRQFHRVEVKASDIQSLFTGEFRIQSGEGPELHVFVPPGEVTARFAWTDDQEAFATVAQLLGLNSDDPDESGIEGPDLPGFTLMNAEREIKAHSRAVAAELLAAFSDNIQGRAVTRVPADGLKLVGNMHGATIQATASPSARVVAVHEFPGQQKPLSRMAFLPESARYLILGTLPFGRSVP